MRGEEKLAAGVGFAVHGPGEGSDGVGGIAAFGGRADVDGRAQQVGLQVCAQEFLSVDGPVEDVGDGDGGADGSVGRHG